jgi:Fic family protein
MAYIYKKIIKGKPYYYLRVSKRVNGKQVVKDVAYLGREVSKIQDKLDVLPSTYKKDIRKAYRNIKKYIESERYKKKIQSLKLKTNQYLSKELLLEIESARLHFKQDFSKLDERTKDEVYKNFLIEFAFNTTSIEGNTITLEEAARLLQENKTPKDRTLREIYDLQNTEKVFFDLLKSKKRISHELIIKIHDDLVENIDQRKGYRNHDLRVFKSNFETSPPRYIRADMSIILEWYEKNKKRLHPLVLAGLIHQKFEKIHPFSDGNGRAGRMVINYLLLKSDYPPLIVQNKNRTEYLHSLAKADEAGLKESDPDKFKELTEFLASEMIASYWDNFLV